MAKELKAVTKKRFLEMEKASNGAVEFTFDGDSPKEMVIRINDGAELHLKLEYAHYSKWYEPVPKKIWVIKYNNMWKDGTSEAVERHFETEEDRNNFVDNLLPEGTTQYELSDFEQIAK